MKTIWKKYFLVLISLFSFTSAGVVVWACGWGPEDDEVYFNFLNPTIINADTLQIGDSAPSELRDENLSEWQQFFKGALNSADLGKLVYTARLGEIDTLLNFIKSKSTVIPPEQTNKSILAIGDKKKVKDFLYYLGFAKRCETYSLIDYSEWYYDRPKIEDSLGREQKIIALIDGGKKQVNNAESGFIKERYLFQILRLYYQAAKYEDCVAFYKNNEANFKSSESIKYRSMGYEAAALYKMKLYAEANYLYGYMYQHYPKMAGVAYWSFHPQEEADWKKCIALAKNDSEKVTLWNLLGMQDDPERAARAIYHINPKAPELGMLLMKAMGRGERASLPEQYGYEYPRSKSLDLFELKPIADTAFVNFIGTVANEHKTAKPVLWTLSYAYLLTMNHDYEKAKSFLAKISEQAKDDEQLKQQAHIIGIVNEIEHFDKIKNKEEEYIASELGVLNKGNLNTHQSGDVYKWALLRVSAKFMQQRDTIKALCFNMLNKGSFFQSDRNVHRMIDYMKTPNVTLFDTFAKQISTYGIPQLYEYLAVEAVYKSDYTQAEKIILNGSPADSTILPGNPFEISMNDCHDCDHAASNYKYGSKIQFIKDLKILEEKTKSNPTNADNYFQLANARYNITFYGNARAFYGSTIEYGDSYTDYYYDNEQKKNARSDLFDCSKAEEYYVKAMNLSTDKEFKATCCFMAAKCEQNSFYNSRTSDFHYGDADFRSGKYFKMLKANYKDTKYYEEIIAECGYFAKYLGKK